jgi:hypothetical protein
MVKALSSVSAERFDEFWLEGKLDKRRTKG